MRLIKLLLLLLLLPSLAWGACGGTTTVSGDTYTAYDVSYDCVALAVSDAEAGGYGKTVQIPAGTGTGYDSYTQLEGSTSLRYIIKVTKNMRIVGAGVGSTFLQITAPTTPDGDSAAVFVFAPDATAIENTDTLSDTGIFEVTGITFEGAYQSHIDAIGIDPNLTSIVKRIRFHNNRLVYMNHIIGGEVGFSHGLVDNNFIFNGSFYYMGASAFNLNNRSYPGDGGGWYFEDNVTQLSYPGIRSSTDKKGVKTSEFTYWLNQTFYTKAEVDNTALPAGTILQGKWGIFRMSIDADGTITITPGTANFTTGYDSNALAIAAVPSVPEGEANVGHFTIVSTAADFVCGTTLLDASGVTYYRDDYGVDIFGIGGGNNSGVAITVRYNKLYGKALYDSPATSFFYFDMHSNQLGITGGQHTEMYGNNLTASTYFGTISALTDTRGQKNIYFYNQTPNTASTIVVREEYNDHYSVSDQDPTSEGTAAALAALDMCASRTAADGSPTQSCPGYLIGTNDSCNCWKVHDSYYVNNRRLTSGTLQPAVKSDDHFHHNNNVENDPVELLENREFFNYVAPESFDADSGGVTCLANTTLMNAITPSGCTGNATCKGVAVWVPTSITDMPCTEVLANNIKQTEGVNPVTPITGTLYKWDGDSWEPFWVPYTYPHPLRGVASTSQITGTVITGAVIK